MLLGTQWYILFNVIAGAMAIPADLKEAARSYRIRGWRLFRILYFPAVFPYLVTGWVTAAGGAWNASIVAEYVTYKDQVITAHGLGAANKCRRRKQRFPPAGRQHPGHVPPSRNLQPHRLETLLPHRRSKILTE